MNISYQHKANNDHPPMTYSYEEHDMGSSWLKYSDIDQCSYVYVNIPKNASSWIKHHFTYGIKYNYIDHSYHPAPGSIVTSEQVELYEKSQRFVVALRDPLERWISGFAQYSLGWSPNDPKFIKNVRFNDALDQMVHDIHTRPQIDFIENIPRDHVVWFRCDQDLEKNFIHFAMSKFNGIDILHMDQDINNIFNVSSKVPAQTVTWEEYHSNGTITKHSATGMTQQEIIDYIKQILDENPKYVRQIESFYRDDYELIDQAQFYQIENII